MKRFKKGVSERLKYYVYRLVDPRNGHTFYVGKGKDDRVFHHVTGALKARDKRKRESLKLEYIQDIHLAGLEPIHVIHRHNMDEKTAIQVEAAVMDAFMTLTNIAAGQGSKKYGPANVDQLNEQYASEFIPTDSESPVVVIKITKRGLSRHNNRVYDTVRSSWVMSERRAKTVNAVPHLVLAVLNGRCVGVFSVPANAWVESSRPTSGRKQRYEFSGSPANKNVAEKYLRKVFDSKSQWPVRCYGF